MSLVKKPIQGYLQPEDCDDYTKYVQLPLLNRRPVPIITSPFFYLSHHSLMMRFDPYRME